MTGDNQKKSEQPNTQQHPDGIQELPEQSISERDAQSVKGGMLPNIKESKK